MKNILGKRSDWMSQAVTTNVDADLSNTFILDAEGCDLQVRREFRPPADNRDGVKRATICSEDELNDLSVSIFLLFKNNLI